MIRAPVGAADTGARAWFDRSAEELAGELADGLGDERHRAAGARVDLDQVDEALLDRELDVHQPAHAVVFGCRGDYRA